MGAAAAATQRLVPYLQGLTQLCVDGRWKFASLVAGSRVMRLGPQADVDQSAVRAEKEGAVVEPRAR
jgi:hypothetical protein